MSDSNRDPTCPNQRSGNELCRIVDYTVANRTETDQQFSTRLTVLTNI